MPRTTQFVRVAKPQQNMFTNRRSKNLLPIQHICNHFGNRGVLRSISLYASAGEKDFIFPSGLLNGVALELTNVIGFGILFGLLRSVASDISGDGGCSYAAESFSDLNETYSPFFLLPIWTLLRKLAQIRRICLLLSRDVPNTIKMR